MFIHRRGAEKQRFSAVYAYERPLAAYNDSVISTEGRLNRQQRFERRWAGPKGEGQEARSKSSWIQEISHIRSR